MGHYLNGRVVKSQESFNLVCFDDSIGYFGRQRKIQVLFQMSNLIPNSNAIEECKVLVLSVNLQSFSDKIVQKQYF